MKFIIWFIAFLVPIVPLAVLNAPWWGIALYTLFSFFHLGMFVNPITFLWALIVEIQRIRAGNFDTISVIFFISFGIYFVYWVLGYVLPLLRSKRAILVLVVSIVIVVFIVYFFSFGAANQEITSAEISFKIAGVTLYNSNGSNRQQILSDLMSVYGENNPMPCRFAEYQSDGIPAFNVYVGTKIVGTTQDEDVYKLKSMIDSIEKSTLRISTTLEHGMKLYNADAYIKLHE